MGSGETKRSKRRSRSPSSSASSDSKHSRERKEKHKHKHKKHKKEHKKHHSSDKDKEKALLAKQAKEFLKQHLKNSKDGTAAGPGPSSSGQAVDRGPVAGKPAGTPDIGPDDYFQRAPEFTAWVQEQRHTLFNELTTEESHKLFADFVAAWNDGKLPLKYYQGLVTAPKVRTSHNWNLKGLGSSTTGARGMTGFMEDERDRKQEARASARTHEADERKRWKADQKLLLDELLPKATGREAAVEARMARREAAKAREDSPELMRVTGGGDLMGGGDSFAAAKAREEARNQWRARAQAAKREELAAKLTAAQEAEAAKMASLRALVAAGPITIPKRQP